MKQPLTAEEIQEAIALYRHLRNHVEVKATPFPKPMCKICDKFSSEILKEEGTIDVIPLSRINSIQADLELELDLLKIEAKRNYLDEYEEGNIQGEIDKLIDFIATCKKIKNEDTNE